MMRKIQRTQQGFTLIEVMITVVVVAILAAIAYPSYTEQVAKGRRAEAQATLLAGQQWMERFYTENYRYDKNSADTAVTDSSQFPARFSQSPPDTTQAKLYALEVSAPTRDSYTITATRSASGAMRQDRCGDFSVNHLGRRSIANYSTKAGASFNEAMAYCWK
ncbi:type IV pilin protein [Variovorax sp. HJSM1_2]|uniref:type IV pilin protein n=1 Tax=Variovorax sp. HJSM1_2 TaxID=3366263 RepID=UPI003BD153B6